MADKIFKMGAGTTYKYVGFWFPLTKKEAVNFPEMAGKIEAERPDECQGICDHCGTSIVYHHIVEDVNGERFSVGSECIKKLEDTNLANQAESVERDLVKKRKALVKIEKEAFEREVNGGLTNKEMRKKCLDELKVQLAEKRKSIVAPVVDMIKIFNMRGNKKNILWKYSDTLELIAMLQSVDYPIDHETLKKALSAQIEFNYKTKVIGNDLTLFESKNAEFEEKFSAAVKGIAQIEKEQEVLKEKVKKTYK